MNEDTSQEILRKLNSIQNDVSELAQNILNNTAEVTAINKTLAPVVTALETCLNELKVEKEKNLARDKTIAEQKSNIFSLKRNEVKNNILMFGLPEEKEDNYNMLLREVLEIFAKVDLSIDKKDINNLYRLGRNKSNRPVLVKFISYITKTEVMGKYLALKQIGITIRNDRTTEEREEYKRALPYLQKLREMQLNAKFRNGKILLEGKTYNLEEIDLLMNSHSETESASSECLSKSVKRKEREEHLNSENIVNKRLQKFVFRKRADSLPSRTEEEAQDGGM